MRYQAHAKVNIFLKIVGTREQYHELVSRFMVVPSLYDTLFFAPKTTNEAFELVGPFDCPLEKNTLFKIYEALKKAGFEEAVSHVMRENALHVEKRIPTGAGLGGGSSDAATFLKMLNEKAKLGLSVEALMEIGARVGADVPFFVAGYASANVRGIGEVVESFHEDALDIEVFTPALACNTALVYGAYRAHFLETIDAAMAEEMVCLPSQELLKRFMPETLNDLFGACLKAYPELASFVRDGWFFSGSGSSFFRIKEVKNG